MADNEPTNDLAPSSAEQAAPAAGIEQEAAQWAALDLIAARVDALAPD